MAYTAPTTRATSDLVTASIWNTDLVNNISFLANPPACRVYHGASQSIPHNAVTTLAFNSERYDTNTMHDTVTNNSRITFSTAGLYAVTLNLQLETANDFTLFMAIIRLGGATVIAGQEIGTNVQIDENMYLSVATQYKFAAADYIEARVRHRNTAAAAKNILSVGNTSPEFAATWIGLG